MKQAFSTKDSQVEEIDVTLPGKKSPFVVRIPKRNLGEILSPNKVIPKGNFQDLMSHALYQPIGCAPLSEQIKPGDKLLIIVEDITRSAPTHRIVPGLLKYLLSCGVHPENIRFAMALGTHRPMTDEEMTAKLGDGIVGQYEIINTPAQNKTAFIDTGQVVDGVPIEVNSVVLESDLVIGVGSVIPHSDVGWSGGCKLILPGMCSERTVNENHFMSTKFDENMLGKQSTSIRENMEAIVTRIGLHYVINAVYTPDGQVIDIVGGHFIDAQRAAISSARDIYSVPYHEKTDIVISSSYPYEIDGWQGSKGIWAGELMLKTGGALIVISPAHEGIGPHPDYFHLMSLAPEQILYDVQSGLLTDKNMAAGAYQVAKMLDHIRLAIVSEGITQKDVGNERIKIFTSLQETVDHYLPEYPPDCKVSFLTHGGYSYPIQIEN